VGASANFKKPRPCLGLQHGGGSSSCSAWGRPAELRRGPANSCT
jgi:hypothetical protein